ncbi:MAG: Dabb family protein [Clostridia bacterium]|nr:Dabb family protein [Clostridia bacterium]
MVKHIVCFKLGDNSPEKCLEAKNVLMSMVGKVPTALDINVGIDFLHSDRSCDIILEVTLKDRNALEEYQNDAYHCEKVKPYMHSVRTASYSVDYEF